MAGGAYPSLPSCLTPVCCIDIYQNYTQIGSAYLRNRIDSKAITSCLFPCRQIYESTATASSILTSKPSPTASASPTRLLYANQQLIDQQIRGSRSKAQQLRKQSHSIVHLDLQILSQRVSLLNLTDLRESVYRCKYPRLQIQGSPSQFAGRARIRF